MLVTADRTRHDLKLLKELPIDQARNAEELKTHLTVLKKIAQTYSTLIPPEEKIDDLIKSAKNKTSVLNLSKKIAGSALDKLIKIISVYLKAITPPKPKPVKIQQSTPAEKDDYPDLVKRLLENHKILQKLGKIDLYLSAYVSFLQEGHTSSELVQIDSSIEELRHLCATTSSLVGSLKLNPYPV